MNSQSIIGKLRDGLFYSSAAGRWFSYAINGPAIAVIISTMTGL
jgi:hypothetical protein